MAKKKGRAAGGGRGKTGMSSKTQVVEALCPTCCDVKPIVHVQTIGVKKRWSWNCTSCNAEVAKR